MYIYNKYANIFMCYKYKCVIYNKYIYILYIYIYIFFFFTAGSFLFSLSLHFALSFWLLLVGTGSPNP